MFSQYFNTFLVINKLFINITCLNNLSADTQLFMIVVVLFFTCYFLYYISVTKYYYEYYYKG